MVVIVVPEWVTKARKELNEFVDDLVRKNNVDWVAAQDSKFIESGKETIVNSLWRIYDSTNVEQRKEFDKLKEETDKLKDSATEKEENLFW